MIKSHNGHVAYLPAILKAKGVQKIVLSPGSRNAPLLQAFYAHFGDACLSIVDERSAAYYALGIAMYTQTPVVLICTSGTAALNYAPALAEAYHQGIPLLAITADRPSEWIGMQDNQAIKQHEIYSGNSKAFYQLPVSVNDPDDEWYLIRMVNEAYNKCVSGKPGSVHVNVPLREPLYNAISKIDEAHLIHEEELETSGVSDTLKKKWLDASKILLVIGQLQPDIELNDFIECLSMDRRIAVFAEPVSNVTGQSIISNPGCVSQITEKERSLFKPDLVVYMGGQLISKQLKNYIRENKDTEQWYVSPEKEYVDTFKALDRLIGAKPTDFISALTKILVPETASDYASLWRTVQKNVNSKTNELIKSVSYSDLQVFGCLSGLFTTEDILFAGNSSCIRYMQLFPMDYRSIYSNRGTSGIDGCLSTASGIARVTDRKVVAVLGDLSFLYDSNALWNKELPENLKIVLINNQGGGIFGMIEGPDTQETYESFFRTHHQVDIRKMAEAYGVSYSACEAIEELEQTYKQFYNQKGCSILEIHTPGDLNPGIFRNFTKKLSNQDE